MMRAAREHVRDCPCEDGCPSCVGVGPADERTPFVKETTAKLLDMLVMFNQTRA